MASTYFIQSNIIRKLKNQGSGSSKDPSVEREGPLQHLDCSNWQLGPAELTLMAEAIASCSASQDSVNPLVTIDMTRNRICGTDIFMTDNADYSGLNNFVTSLVAIAKYSRLKKINFSYNLIDDEGLKIVSELISANGPIYLLELVLRACGGKSKGLNAISKQLESNRTLISLELDENNFNTKSINNFSEQLKQNRRLKTLSLNSCNIGSDAVASLVGMLQVNYTLCVLSLACNQIGDEGAEVFGNGLKAISTLTHLDLQENSITTQGCAHILNGLSKNTSLIFLGLKWNLISDSIVENFRNCLESNNTLRYVYLLGNPLQPATAESIVQMSSKFSGREKPLDIDLTWPS